MNFEKETIKQGENYLRSSLEELNLIKNNHNFFIEKMNVFGLKVKDSDIRMLKDCYDFYENTIKFDKDIKEYNGFEFKRYLY